MAARAGVVHMARLNQSVNAKPSPSKVQRTFSTEEQAARSQAQLVSHVSPVPYTLSFSLSLSRTLSLPNYLSIIQAITHAKYSCSFYILQKIDREAREEVLQAHYGHRAFYCLPFEHPIRQFAIRTVESRWFRMAVLFVIFLNSVCVVR